MHVQTGATVVAVLFLIWSIGPVPGMLVYGSPFDVYRHSMNESIRGVMFLYICVYAVMAMISCVLVLVTRSGYKDPAFGIPFIVNNVGGRCGVETD
jgi:hypothetical protein